MVHALILAGGSGTRLLGSELPKQYIEIDGITLLERVTNVFLNHELIDTLTIVAPSEYVATSKRLLSGKSKPIDVISGGATRQESSKLGLLHLQMLAKDDDIVLIHDAARVLIDPEIISRGISLMSHYHACSAAIEAKDSLRKVASDGLLGDAIDRNLAKIIQTPQVFRFSLILEAHVNPKLKEATDDISLLPDYVRLGYFRGSELNFKVTTTNDLLMLQALINQGINYGNH